MPIKIKDGETILFIGDSITDCGRRTTERPLGNGYVKLFADLVTIREPAKKVTIINKGIGGDRVIWLRNRWTDDVLRHKPNWLSVKIGINDLWSAMAQLPEAVPPEKFCEAYDDILSRTRKELPRCEILLVDPFYLSIDKVRNSVRKDVLDMLPKYIRIVHEMGRKHRTRLIKTHELYQALLRYHEADTFCAEPVHPNLTGHLAIAEAVYMALSR